MSEPWYILTSLDNVEEVIKVYEQRRRRIIHNLTR
jgi:hypothetical protein